MVVIGVAAAPAPATTNVGDVGVGAAAVGDIDDVVALYWAADDDDNVAVLVVL